MKQGQIFLLIVMAILLFQSCRKLEGDGPVVTDQRSTPDFSGIQLKVPAKLIYTEGAVYKIELISQQNILNNIETILSGNDLIIRFRHSNTNLKSGEEINIKITAPAVSKLEVHGSGNIESQTSFAPSSLRLAIFGSGHIFLADVVTDKLDAEISGSGKIKIIEGLTGDQPLKIAGSGEMDFVNFITKKSKTSISGSGNILLNVAELLDVNISGSGTVKYRGNPVVTSSITGSGAVSKW